MGREYDAKELDDGRIILTPKQKIGCYSFFIMVVGFFSMVSEGMKSCSETKKDTITKQSYTERYQSTSGLVKPHDIQDFYKSGSSNYNTYSNQNTETYHTVRFYNKNGDHIATQLVRHGESAKYFTPNNEEGFLFRGWNTSLDYVRQDLNVYGVYEQEQTVYGVYEQEQTVDDIVEPENNVTVTVPSLIGLPVFEASRRIENLALYYNIKFDVTPSSEDEKRFYKVYRQMPDANEKLEGRQRVTIYVTTDQSKLAPTEKTESVLALEANTNSITIDTRSANESGANATYIVKNGETLWGICKRQGCTISELEKLNPKLKFGVHAGDVLILPASED